MAQCMAGHNCTQALCCHNKPCRYVVHFANAAGCVQPAYPLVLPFCSSAPALDPADNTVAGACAAVPKDHGATCNIQCTNFTFVPDGANTNATFTCVKGQWVPPAPDHLACQRSCLSVSFCTGQYQRRSSMSHSPGGYIVWLRTHSCAPPSSLQQ
jgi:hypothetical protein